MKEKKGNKGKKSLVDLKNFRSTRLKELTFGALIKVTRESSIMRHKVLSSHTQSQVQAWPT